MKRVMNLIAVAALTLSVMSVSAQDKSETKVHPDIEKYTKMYDLDRSQVEQLTKIYIETGEKGMAVEKELKDTQIKQRETMKTATQSEKARMNSETDKLAKERLMLKEEREKKMVSLLNEDQLKLYKQNKAKASENVKEKPTSVKEKPMKRDSKAPLAQPVKQDK